MAVVRVQAALERDSGLPEDRVINTWHCTTQSNDTAGRAAETALFVAELKVFYDNVDALLSASIDGDMTFTAYDLAEAEPRAPFFVEPHIITPGLGAYPGEVALCMSFQGVQISGTSQARRRGRVFLGPMSSTTGEFVGGFVRPTDATQNGIAVAGGGLLAASEATFLWSWIIFSPTSAGPELPDGTYTNLAAGIVVVNNGWVDNAFDTIRSRGPRTTSRYTFS